MDKSERIYIPPKERDLPRKYRLGLDRPNYNLRHLSLALFALAAITGVIWLVLR